MKKLRVAAFWFALAICWYLYWPIELLSQQQPVTLSLPESCEVNPAGVCYADVEVKITPHPDNEKVVLVWGIGADTKEFKPENLKHTIMLSPGKHTVYAVLLRQHGSKQEVFEARQEVDVAEKPVVLSVYPKAVLAMPFKRSTIRVEWRIARHPDNRWWAFSYVSDDNGDVSSSGGELNGTTDPVVYPICLKSNPRPCFRQVTSGTYHMVACVYRSTNGEVKQLCDRYTLRVQGVEP